MTLFAQARPVARLGPLLALLIVSTIARAQIVTTNWSGTADWSSTSNWTTVGGLLHTLPLVTDVAGIGAGTSVTVSDARSVGAIAFSGGTITGAGTLTISDTGSTWTGGTMSGTGTTIVSGTNTLALSGSSNRFFTQRTLTTNGTVTWTGTGGVGGGGGGTFNNNGTFDLQGDASWFNQFGGAATTINNAGSITRTVGTGTAALDMAVVNGAGSLSVQSGTLRLSNSVGTTTAGTLTGAITIGAGTTLDFAGATYNINSGATYTGTGITNVSGSTVNFAITPNLGTLSIASGIANLNAGATASGGLTMSGGTGNFSGSSIFAGPLTMSGGTQGGTGSITINGNGSQWTGGTLSGTGSTIISGTNTLAISGATNRFFTQRTLTTNGAVTWTGTGGIGGGGGGTFNNNGAFDFQANASWFNQFGGAATTFNNAGSITRTVGTGTAAFDMAVLNGAGSIDVQTGTLRLSNSVSTGTSGTLTGAISVANGATLEFAGATYNVNSPATQTGAGTTVVSGATVNYGITPAFGTLSISSGIANLNAGMTASAGLMLSGGTANFAGTSTVNAPLTFSSGTLGGTGTLNISGTGSQWTGGTMSGTGSTVFTGTNTLAISGTTNRFFTQRTLTTNGAVTWTGTGGIGAGGGGTFNNNGTLDMQGDVSWFNQFGGTPTTINNAGGITRTVGTGTAALDMAVVNGAGSISAQTGTLRLSNSVSAATAGSLSGPITIASGATLEFAGATYGVTGNISGAGNLNLSGGTFNPTGQLALTGGLTVSGATANFNPSATLTAGSLTVSSGTGTFSTAVTDAGGLSVSGGTANFNAATSVGGSLTLSAGTVGGTGTLTINGNGDTWTGGTMSGTGTTVISGTNPLAISGTNNKFLNQRTLTTNGAVTWTGTGGIGSGGGSTFNNNGSFNIQGDVSWFNQFGGTPTTINNAGSITRSVGTGTAALDMAVVNGAGSIDVQTGTLRLSNSVSGATAASLSGPITVASGATLEFASATYGVSGNLSGAGNLTLSGGTFNPTGQLTLTGALTLSGSTANFSPSTSLTPASIAVSSGTGNFNVAVADAAGLNLSGGAANFNAATSIAGALTLSGGTLGGTGVVTINGNGSTWTGGTMNGTGSTVFSSGNTLALSGTNNRFLTQRTLTTNGTVTWTGTGGVGGGGGGTFNNNGPFDIQGNVSWFNQFGGTPTTLNNAGSITRTVGTGTAALDMAVVNGAGSIDVQTGTLRLSNSVSTATAGTVTGNVSVASGTTLEFAGATYNMNGTVTSAGNLAVTGGVVNFANPIAGAGTMSITGGAANFTTSLGGIGALTISGGTLGGTGTATIPAFTQTGGTIAVANLSLTGSINWTAGNWNSTSASTASIATGKTLTINDAVSNVFDFNYRAVTNFGTVNWANGYIRSGQGGTFINAAGATFNDIHTNSGYTINNPFGGGFVFQNDGTYNRNVAGTTYFDTPFNNNGTLNLQQGDIQIRQGGTMGATSVVNAVTGTHLYFTNSYTLNDGAQFAGAGLFNQTGGTLTINGALKAPAFLWSGGNWNVPVVAGGTLPTTTIASGTTLNLTDANDSTRDFNFRNVVNNGTVNWTNGYIRSGQGGTFTNAAGATFNDTHTNSGYTVNNPFGGTFVFENDGAYVHNVAGATTYFDTTFNNNGAVNVQAGDVQFRSGGTLGASGTINASAGTNVFFTNNYNVANGSSLTGAGTYWLTGGNLSVTGALTTSNFKQTGGTLSGTNSIVGTFNWSGGNWNAPVVAGGTLPTTTIASGTTLNLTDANDSTRDFNFRNVVNNGAVNWTNGYIRSGQGGTFTNAAGATFTDTHTNSGYTVNDPFGGTFVFTNNGTYVHNVANATTFFDTQFDNNGAVNVQNGDVQFRAGGTLGASGTINASAGTNVFFTNNYNVANGSSLTGAGSYWLTGGTLSVTGALTISNFKQTGGTLSGTNSIVGTFNWSGGNWNAPVVAGGTLPMTTIALGTTLNLTDANDGTRDFNFRNVVNNGTVNWANGHIRSGQGGTFTNAAGATFNDTHTNSGYTINNPFGGGFVFQNDGTYNRNATGTTSFDTTFNNNGTLNLQQGDIQIRQGGTMSATSIVNGSAGTHLYFTNNFTLSDGAQFTGAGLFDQTGGTLSINGALKASAFLWSGGNWNGTGSTSIALGTILNLSDANDGTRDFDLRNVVNNGTVNWTNGHIRSGQGGTFTNAAGATFNDTHTNSGYTINNPFGGSFVFQNDGTYVHNVNATTFFDTTFVNNGLLSLQAGDVQIRQGGTMSATSIVNAAAGAHLYFTNNFTLTDGAQFTGTGLFDQTGGTLSLNGALKASAFLWSGGNWNGAGSTSIASGTILNLSDANDGSRDFNSRTIVNNGTVNWTNGHIRSGQGGTFTNAAGATFNDTHTNSGYTVNNPFGGSFVFQNDGTYVHNVNATTFFDTTFVNNGLLSLQTGDIQLRQGGTMGASSVVNAATGTHLYITNNYTLLEGAQFTGTGLMAQTGGTLTADGAIRASAFTWSGGNWNVPVVAGGTLPTTTIASGTVLNLSDASDGNRDFNFRNIVNNGTVNWTNGHLRSGQGGTFTNAAGATFNDTHANSGYTINNPFGGTFVFQNDGTYNRNATGTTSAQVPFVNTGTVRSQGGGTLAFTSTFTNTGGSLIASGGNFSFSGALNVGTGNIGGAGTFTASTVTAGGHVSPGNPTGLMTIAGNLTLLGTATSQFDIGGTTRGSTFDAIHVTGTAALAGSLEFSFLNGAYAGLNGTESFNLLDATSVTGAFSNIASGGRLDSADGVGSFLVTLNGTSLTLSNFVLNAGAYVWSGGDLGTIGNLAPSLLPSNTVSSSSILAIVTSADHDFDGQTLTNNGRIDWGAGRLRSGDGGSIVNNGTFNDAVTVATDVNADFGNHIATFTNAASGIYNKNGAVTTQFLDVPFNNSGTVNIFAGTLQLHGGGTNAGTGAFNTAAGATTQFSNNYTLANGSNLAGAGNYDLTAGTLTTAGTVTIARLNQLGGVLAGTSTFTNSLINWTGGNWNSGAQTTTIAGTSRLVVDAAGDHDYDQRIIVNNGAVDWNAGRLRSGDGGSFANNASFNDNLAAATDVNADLGNHAATFTNTATGTYTKNGNVTTRFYDVPFNNSGQVNVLAGTLQINGGGINSASGVFTTASGALTLFTNSYALATGSTLGGAGTYELNAGTLTATGTISVSHLSLTGGALAGSYTFANSDVTWTGGNWNTGVATTTIGGGSHLALVSSNDHDYDQRSVINNGTIDWYLGRLRSGDGGSLTNNATFNDQLTAATDVNADFGNHVATFVNALGATYAKLTNVLTRFYDVPFNNQGAVFVNAGTLQINGGGTNSATGVFQTASGARTLFSNNYTLAGGSALAGAGTYELSGGSLDASGTVSISNLQQTGGMLTNSQIFANSLITWSGGNWNASAGQTTTINPTSRLMFSGAIDHDYDQRAIVNQGIVDWNAGRLRSGDGGSFTNNAQFNDLVAAATEVNADFGNHTATFTNANGATYTKSVASTTRFLDVPFNNGGQVNVDAGTLQLNGGGINAATGRFAVATGAALWLSNSYTLSDGSNLAGPGPTTATGGTLTVNGSVNISNLVLDGSLLAGTQTFHGAVTWNNGSLNSNGTTTVAGDGIFTVSNGIDHDFDSRSLVNNGATNWTAGRLRSGDGGSIVNAGTWNDTASSVINADFGNHVASFTNTGTYNKTAAGTTSIQVPFTNDNGTITVSAGTLQFTSTFNQIAGSLAVSQGASLQFNGGLTLAAGTLGGNGTIVGNVTNQGQLSPGSSPGQLNINGNLTLASTSVLLIELGGLTQGSTYDFLNVSGTAALDGSLRLTFVNNAYNVVAPTDVFTVMTASSLTGAFSNLPLTGSRLALFDGSGSFQVNYGVGSAFAPNSLILSDFVAVPEPSTWAMIGAGFVVLLLQGWRRNRRS